MPWSNSPADRKRSSAVYGAAWRKARDAAMRRANWKCELRMDGCQGAASEVDHIDGAANDPQHKRLRSVCSSCHAKRTAQQGGGYRRGRAADPDPVRRTQW